LAVRIAPATVFQKAQKIAQYRRSSSVGSNRCAGFKKSVEIGLAESDKFTTRLERTEATAANHSFNVTPGALDILAGIFCG
jgi:hypothetical protein